MQSLLPGLFFLTQGRNMKTVWGVAKIPSDSSVIKQGTRDDSLFLKRMLSCFIPNCRFKLLLGEIFISPQICMFQICLKKNRVFQV